MISVLNFLLIIFCFGSGTANNVQAGPGQRCQSIPVDPRSMNVHAGWPQKILCNSIKVFEYLSSEKKKKLFQNNPTIICKIWSQNKSLLMNETAQFIPFLNEAVQLDYDLPDLKENDPLDYIIEIDFPILNACMSMKVHFDIKPLPSCEEVLHQHHFSRSSMSIIGNPKLLSCTAERSVYPKIYTKNVTYEWNRNCSESVPQDMENRLQKLFIPKVELKHAGVYVCVVKYHGMNRYYAVEDVCVKYRPVKATHQTMSCQSETINKNPGKNAEFQCRGNFGESNLDDLHFAYKWMKKMPNGTFSYPKLCMKAYDHQSASTDRISCTYTNENSRCIYHIEKEAELPKAIVPVKLEIKNIIESDYGTYVLIFETISNILKPVNVTLTLKQDENAMKRTLIVAISTSCVTILILLILLTAVIFKFKIYLKVYFKRHYGSFVTDDRKFGAYLVYNASNSLDRFARENLETSVHLTRIGLEDMCYRVYDEYRDGFNQSSKAENILYAIKNSHRVIIFLTLEYLNDDWSMQTLQKGLDDMIQLNKKLIFILTPGIKEYVKQHKHDKTSKPGRLTAETCRVVERAMKLNDTLKWSNKSQFSKKLFKLQLEAAMPKLRSQNKKDRSLSSSSEFSGTQQGYKAVKYERGISNETQTSELL